MPKFKKQLFGDPIVNQHIAEVTGQKYHNCPFAWVSGKASYSHITGGIILPSFDHPGFLLTVGVRHKDQKYELIEEFESWEDRELQEKATSIQKEYGSGVISNWWGDPTKLMALVNQKNINSDEPVFISTPPDFEQKDSFQIYVISLHTALRRGNKVLYIGKCSKLKNYLEDFILMGAKAENHPAVNLAGWLVHTLNIYRPWEQAVESTALIPTAPEDFYIHESEKAIKELEDLVYGRE
jgi:hypothetical protein